MTTGIRKNTHEMSDWVKIYSNWQHLLKPEEVILENMRARLPCMRMLDIGIGGGRTTCHFAELAKEYIGIDFDDHMIQSCKKRFSDAPKKVSFVTCDVRAMSIFEDGYFDFILFSFNGLDYLGHDDRGKALREIRRVGKKGEYFFFSAHNLNCIDDDPFRLAISRNPIKLSKSLWKYFLVRIRNDNPKKLKSQEYAVINDGMYHKRLKWVILSFWKRLGYFYYIKPEAQIKQLENSGFKNIKVYSLQGGEITDMPELRTTADLWLYYLCEI